MRFLLDMGLARSTARHLRQQGHDAVHLRDQGLQRLLDEGIIAKAQAEGRVILTTISTLGASLRSAKVPFPV
jgi:predicted nuclease of predicted toxin-antitoxin system